MEKEVKIWHDAEADYLEVMFSDQPGCMTPTDHDTVMEMSMGAATFSASQSWR